VGDVAVGNKIFLEPTYVVEGVTSDAKRNREILVACQNDFL
jgi:hypothetical protein